MYQRISIEVITMPSAAMHEWLNWTGGIFGRNPFHTARAFGVIQDLEAKAWSWFITGAK